MNAVQIGEGEQTRELYNVQICSHTSQESQMQLRWELFKDGTNTPVAWVAHPQNTRFLIYSPTPRRNHVRDVVWDQETGLLWARNANLLGQSFNWLDANTEARVRTKLAHRQGWRLPAAEELASLVDTRKHPALPTGHPFLNVQYGASNPAYWTSTDAENPGNGAWFVNFNGQAQGAGGIGLGNKGLPGFVWPVRGGRGGVTWNW